MLSHLLRRRAVEVDPDSPWQSEADGQLGPIPYQAAVLFPKPPLVAWLHGLDKESDRLFADATLEMYAAISLLV
jgi:hypothetical protein